LLVLSEVWDPGWSATVSGVNTPVMLADYILRAIPVPSGEHRVVLRYEPPLLRVGAAITGATLIVCIGIAWWSTWRTKRKSEAT
jgi:uncharacterized membrane protein YfhO